MNSLHYGAFRLYFGVSTPLRTLRYANRIRQFHSSRPNRLINEGVLVAHSVLEGVHSLTSLPWVASIPLTAVLVRLTVATPLQIYSIIHARRAQRLSPLLQGWGRNYQKLIMKEAGKNGRYLSVKDAESQSQSLLNKKRKELFKRWKVARWASVVPFLQLPIWLAMMESVRRMVGMSGGLLSVVQSWVEKHPEAPQISISESLSTEGALWFPDLIAADPHNILPIVLATTMFTNVTLGWKSKTPEEIARLPSRMAVYKANASGIIKRLFQGMSLLLWPIMSMSGVPSGMLIYWISSSTFATIQTQFLPKLIPSKPVPSPLKRLAPPIMFGSELEKSSPSVSKPKLRRIKSPSSH